MKKILTITLAVIMSVMLLAGCGAEPEKLGCEGDYTLTSMSAMGVSIPGEDKISFTLKPGGKGNMEVEGTKGGIKWTLEGEDLTLIVSGEEIKGTFKNNQAEFLDFQGMGVDCLFTLEGAEGGAGGSASDDSGSAATSNLSEYEQEVVGTWKSVEVQDVLHDDMSASFNPQGLTLTLNPDHTATLVIDDAEYNMDNWTKSVTIGFFEEDPIKEDGTELSVSFSLEDDGRLEVTCSDDDNFLYYYCTR